MRHSFGPNQLRFGMTTQQASVCRRITGPVWKKIRFLWHEKIPSLTSPQNKPSVSKIVTYFALSPEGVFMRLSLRLGPVVSMAYFKCPFTTAAKHFWGPQGWTFMRALVLNSRWHFSPRSFRSCQLWAMLTACGGLLPGLFFSLLSRGGDLVQHGFNKEVLTRGWTFILGGAFYQGGVFYSIFVHDWQPNSKIISDRIGFLNFSGYQELWQVIFFPCSPQSKQQPRVWHPKPLATVSICQCVSQPPFCTPFSIPRNDPLRKKFRIGFRYFCVE